MTPQGRITVRGPYNTFEKRRVASVIENHPFNTEVTCYVPFLEQQSVDNIKEKKIE